MHHAARRPIALLTGFALAFALLAAVKAAPAAALDNGLARTPYLGWNTYYGLGASYDEQTIREEADAIVDRGLKAAGYEYVWIDGGWWSGARDSAGNITVDSGQWPHGMKAVADYIHSRGLKAGIYTDAGRNGCGGADQGSYGHYQQDVDQFAAWGYDAVKVDFCGGTQLHLDPAQAYGDFRDALVHNTSGRPMLFNICNPFTPGAAGNGYPPFERSAYASYTFGPDTGNSWRTDTDIGFFNSIHWADVLRNIDHNASHPEAAGPGHWNDPDYLGPELGMTADQARAQFTLWSISAAPLIVGSDVRKLSDATIAMLTNREVLAVDQDPLAVQGRSIDRQGDAQVWVKPLAGGDRAVALLNRGDSPLTVETTAQAVGMPHASRYELHDLWEGGRTATAGRIAASVAPGSAVLLRVSTYKGNDLPAATTLTAPDFESSGPRDLMVPGSPTAVTATFHNDGRTPVSDLRLTLDAPAGWTVTGGPRQGATVPGRHAVTASWTVTPPAGTLPGRHALTAQATYRSAGGEDTRTSRTSVQVPSAPPAGTGYLSDHPWLGATSGYLVARLDASVGGNPITMQGTRYDKGIGVASPSQVDYYLGGRCSRLTATIGIDDAVNNVGPEGGTATFTVLGDGRSRYESGVVDRSATRSVSVDLTGVEQLRLDVGDAGDGGYNDRADWAGLEIQCDGPVATVPDGAWPHFVADSAMSATASTANYWYPPSAAIDGRLTTFWHSEFQPPRPLPQSITLDLGAVRDVTGLTYQTRLDGTSTGTITGYVVATSADGRAYTDVARGNWADDSEVKSVMLGAASAARYVRLTAEQGDGGYAAAAEIGVADRPVG
jgi:alpha-galactosidase